ncbi:MAG: oxidase [Cyanobacteria bacterium RYN_339]|nr:oxidase [Cyanobacteria bacterium RYN_339]
MTTPAELLARPLVLPCGQVLPNRLAKAALSEAMGTAAGAPSPALNTLFARWAAGGAGLVITGNVMVDRRQQGEPGNVVLEDERHLAAFQAWAAVKGQGRLWMQLNHPGRQAPRIVAPEPIAPSAVPLEPTSVFAPPRAMTEAEIDDVVLRFAEAARVAQLAGFDGVQIHGAHGYLVSQFLSPRTNLRTDAWGGTPAKRRRFALAVVEAVRAATGPRFALGIKLNSADFQRGGIEEEETLDLLAALEAAGVDLMEISGGTYERPVMMGAQRASTREREAYFLDFAERARTAVRTPLMLTGGFRTALGMGAALESGAVDVIGLGRPLAIEPDLPARLLNGAEGVERTRDVAQGWGRFGGFLEIAWHAQQLQRMGRGLDPDPDRAMWVAAAVSLLDNGFSLMSPRRGG